MPNYQLAQINIAKMNGVNINDPVMKEFVDNLILINSLAESSDGFVWRLKGENNNATNLNPYNDEQIIVNISVWQSIEHLEHYVYKTMHTEFLKRRKEWFQKFGKAYYALWWIVKDEYPTVAEAISKLTYMQQNGATQEAFDFKNRFKTPVLFSKQPIL